jgi:hypothetical protein
VPDLFGNFRLQMGISYGNVAMSEGLFKKMVQRTALFFISIAIINISRVAPGG